MFISYKTAYIKQVGVKHLEDLNLEQPLVHHRSFATTDNFTSISIDCHKYYIKICF